LSGCLPDRFFCAPEDPEWDVAEEISAAPIVTPSGNIGLIWEFYDGWRLGGSFHLPFWVEAPATLTTRLASAAPYRNAEQIGEDATVSFQLPWTVRLGIEARDLTPGLRIEVAGTYEHWAIHDAITVEPDGIAITNLPAFPEEYFLPAIEIPRKFQSAVKGHLGAEYFIVASDLVGVTPRLGVSYETSAIAEENVSVLTIDSGKVATSVGLSVHIGDARIDAVYSHQFTQQVEVAAADARIPQVVPLQANTPENPDYINGGIYDWRVDVIGLGFAYTFDKPTPANATPPVEATPDPTTGEKPATPKPLPKDPEVPEEVEPPAETDEDA
jgi:long-chain fatty acid transport protein